MIGNAMTAPFLQQLSRGGHNLLFSSYVTHFAFAASLKYCCICIAVWKIHQFAFLNALDVHRGSGNESKIIDEEDPIAMVVE